MKKFQVLDPQKAGLDEGKDFVT